MDFIGPYYCHLLFLTYEMITPEPPGSFFHFVQFKRSSEVGQVCALTQRVY